MDHTDIPSALKSLCPPYYKVQQSFGSTLYVKQTQFYTLTIGIGYTNFSPKYVFNAASAYLRFRKTARILHPLIEQHFNQKITHDSLPSTIQESIRLSPEFRSTGATNGEDLQPLLNEVKGIWENSLLPWIADNDTLEKIKENLKAKSLEETNRYLGGRFAAFRKMIILCQTGESEWAEQYRDEIIQKFRERALENKKYQRWLDMAIDLDKKLHA